MGRISVYLTCLIRSIKPPAVAFMNMLSVLTFNYDLFCLLLSVLNESSTEFIYDLFYELRKYVNLVTKLGMLHEHN